MDNFCPVCLKKGIKNRIELIQINLDESLLMCKAEKCMWPFGYEEFTFVPRVAGKIWSCYWDNYKRNMLVSKESALMNSTYSTPKIETTFHQGNAPPQSVAKTASLSSNNPVATVHATEPVSNLTRDNSGNTTETLHTDTCSVPCSDDISIITQNIVVQPARKVNPSRRSIETGKRYEKFSFSALKQRDASKPSIDTNNLPDSSLTQQNDSDNKNDVGISEKSIGDESNNSINSNDLKDTNGDNINSLLPTINCQVDIIVPEVPFTKSDTNGTPPTLVNTGENMSVNIECLLNEFLATNAVSSKDTCDDWLDDLLNSTAI